MSVPPKVVLLDSNAYFRLAQSIHPLLSELFGPPPPHSLFVLDVLHEEFASNPRLQNKFEWVNMKQYREDREKKIFASRGEKSQPVDIAFSFFAGYAKNNKLTVSREDIKALAVGHANKGFIVVSDDFGLRSIAAAHNITCWWTLDLLKCMLDCNRVNLEKVQEIVEYWDYQNDLPRKKTDLREQYKALFGQNCPI